MSSSNPYAISPDLLKELEYMLNLMKTRVLNCEYPPEDESWFRFKGFSAAVQLIKNHVQGMDGPNADQIVEDLVPIGDHDE